MAVPSVEEKTCYDCQTKGHIAKYVNTLQTVRFQSNSFRYIDDSSIFITEIAPAVLPLLPLPRLLLKSEAR